MTKLIIAATLVATATLANAATDYQYLNDCTGRGYMYQYCMSRCSYDDKTNRAQPVQPQNPYQVPYMPRMPQTDFKCLNECAQKGYMYQFCQERCSY
jgi:hypothetical protein